MLTITLKNETIEKFNCINLETFINSDDFEDIILGYQMTKGKTGKVQTFTSFKKELGL